MLEPPLQQACRLSGESLGDAPVLLDIADCPLPGIYPARVDAALALRSPLRVVQASGSGLVQLAHRFDDSLYAEYGFAADTSDAYRGHLAGVADEVAASFPADTAVLEVGCGDGLLLALLEERGFHDLLGIDPGRAAARSGRPDIVSGFFPDDLPAGTSGRRFGLIVLRHVLEHVERPREFVSELAARLAPGGELWIEVPDLHSTVAAGLWSNFYQLHCNYFSAGTLDRVAADAGLACVDGRIVDVFGGSLLRRYRAGDPAELPTERKLDAAPTRFAEFRGRLSRLAALLPDGAVGYGAAERTAMTLGASPALASHLDALYDGNPLLHGRRLAGTDLAIRPKEELFAGAPPAVVLFALSHRAEILAEWRERLPGDTLVAIAGGDCAHGRLADITPKMAQR